MTYPTPEAATDAAYRSLGLETPSRTPQPCLADQFGDVDAEIQRLKIRRDALRQQLIDAGQPEAYGARWNVVLEEKTTRRLDAAKLIARFGQVAVEECRSAKTTIYCSTERAR
jgi:hypothetical protein